MSRYHTAEEIRRYDLMKLGVLLLLILLLILTWVATRDQSGLLSDLTDEPAATTVAEGPETENPAATLPEATLGIPSVNLPVEPLQPGRLFVHFETGHGESASAEFEVRSDATTTVVLQTQPAARGGIRFCEPDQGGTLTHLTRPRGGPG